MKRILLYTFLILVSKVHAQYWTEFSTAQPTQSTGVNSISIVNNSNVVWLSNQCGTVGCTPIRRYSKTIDGGVTWTTGEINLGDSTSSLRIANIHGLSANVAYAAVYPAAIGVTGGIWKTEDGGATWNRQSTAFNGATSYPSFVFFWDANEGIAAGDPLDGYYEIYKTSNGGQNWTRILQSPGLVPLVDYEYGMLNRFAIKGDSIWYGCDTGGGIGYGILRSSNDRGLTWQLPTLSVNYNCDLIASCSFSFDFTDPNNGLALTSDYALYSTSDGGSTWTDITPTFPSALGNYMIAAIPGAPNQYISIGENIETNQRGSSYSNDGGLTWIDILDANDVDGSVMKFRDVTTGFAGGFSNSPNDGGIFRWNGFILANATFSNDRTYVASPNPTTGETKISGNDIRKITVFDVFGKQISETNYSGLNNVDLNATSFNAGIYLVRVTNSKGDSSTIKLIKR